MMAQDDTTRLVEAMIRLRQRRSTKLPEALFSGAQPYNMLLVLFVADARGERITGREVAAKAGGGQSTAARWMKYLTAEGLIVGDGEGRLDDVIALTPKGLDAIEDLARQISEELSGIYAEIGRS